VTILAILSISLIFGMVTNLKNVTVEFRQRVNVQSRLEENILDKVKEDGNFEYNKGLLFVNADKSIQQIEKNNPFVKVEQVIRKFPNTLSVYISERVPCCYAENNDYYFVFDKEFKVLDKFESNEQGKEYLIDNYLGQIYEIDYAVSNSIEKGDFVSQNEKITIYKEINNGIVGALKSVSAVKSVELLSDKIVLVLKKDNINFEDGVTIETIGYDDISMQIFTAIEVYEEIDKTKTAQIIRLEKVEGTKNKYRAYLINAS